MARIELAYGKIPQMFLQVYSTEVDDLPSYFSGEYGKRLSSASLRYDTGDPLAGSEGRCGIKRKLMPELPFCW